MAISGESLWGQAVEYGDYKTAEEVTQEEYEQRRRQRAYDSVYVDPTAPLFPDPVAREKALRRQRIVRAFGPAADPDHLLFPGCPLLPREMDCIDKRKLEPGTFEP